MCLCFVLFSISYLVAVIANNSVSSHFTNTKGVTLTGVEFIVITVGRTVATCIVKSPNTMYCGLTLSCL